MAKKKATNFKIEQDELKPITVGYFESRKKSSLGIFIILSMFTLIIIFLPQISNFINNFLDSGNTTTPGYKPNSQIDVPKEEETDDKTYYDYATDLLIADENINLSDFILDESNQTLSFKVINNSRTNLLDLNYYLELYNDNHTLLERIKLVTKENVLAGETKDMIKYLSDDAINVKQFTLSKLDVNEYPVLNLTPNLNGEASLVCENSHEKITYTFNNNKLKKLESEVNYLNTDDNYNDIYNEYRSIPNSYNVLDGISSTFFESATGFSIFTDVNLENASRTYIFNADTFNLDTEAKVVSFEMESQGFDCR